MGTLVNTGAVNLTAGGASTVVTTQTIDYSDDIAALTSRLDTLVTTISAMSATISQMATTVEAAAATFNTAANTFNTAASTFSQGSDTLNQAGTSIQSGGESMVTASDTTSAAMASIQADIRKNTEAVWRLADLKDYSMQTGSITRNVSLSKHLSTGPERLVDILNGEGSVNGRLTLPFGGVP